MFGKFQHIGININDRSIELVAVDDASHPKRISHAARVTLPEGVVIRGKIIKQAKLLRALSSLKLKAGFSEKQHLRTTLSLSEELIFPFSVSFETALQPAQQFQYIRETAKKRLPISEDALLLFMLDTHPSKTTAFVYGVDANRVGEYEDALRQASITIDHIEPEGVAIGRFLLPAEHKNQTTTVIDIGATITHLVTYHEGYPLLSQSLPFGANVLRKKNKSSQSLTEPELAKFLKPYIKELKEKINLADEFSSRYTKESEENELVLVGGGAMLPHIAEELEKRMKRKTRVGSLGQPLDIPRDIKKELPVYSQAVGSALRESSKIAHLTLQRVPETSTSKNIKRSEATLSVFKSRTTLLILLFICLVIVLGSLLYFRRDTTSGPPAGLPTTTVNSAKETTNQTSTLSSLQTISLILSAEDSALPYTIIEENKKDVVTVETTGVTESTGTASGNVIFVNTTGEEKTLVTNTRIQSPSGQIFRIQESIAIPANGELTTRVVADQPGATGDIAAGTQFIIPGLSTYNQERIYARNDQAFTGGKQQISIVSQKDIATAIADLEDSLSEALESIFTQNSVADILVVPIPQSLETTATADPSVGSEAKSTTITVTAQEKAVRFSLADFYQALEGRGIRKDSIVSYDIEIDSYDIDSQSVQLTILLTTAS